MTLKQVGCLSKQLGFKNYDGHKGHLMDKANLYLFIAVSGWMK